MKKNGFSLIEVMIAVAVSGLTILATTQVMSSFYQFKRYLEVTSDYNQFLNEVQMMVDNNANCTNSLGNFQLNASAISNTPTQQAIDFTVGQIFYDVTGATPFIYNNPQSGVRLRRVTLIREPAIAGVAVNLPGNIAGTSYAMKLRVEGELDRTRIKGPSIKPREYSLNVTVRDSNRRIQDCAVTISGTYCKQMGGEWDPMEPNLALRCNLGPVFGGCMQAGGYSLEGGSCTEVHPTTGNCSCPDGYDAYDAMDFVAGGGKSSVSVDLYACYRCASTVVVP